MKWPVGHQAGVLHIFARYHEQAGRHELIAGEDDLGSQSALLSALCSTWTGCSVGHGKGCIKPGYLAGNRPTAVAPSPRVRTGLFAGRERKLVRRWLEALSKD